MSKEEINTKNAPDAIGPYSQAVKTGGLIFTSGQLPINPATGELIKDAEQAAVQALENNKAILEQAGAELGDVVKTVIYLKDLNDFEVVNRVYAGYFKSPFPARSTVQVAELPKGAVLEIEAVAVKN